MNSIRRTLECTLVFILSFFLCACEVDATIPRYKCSDSGLAKAYVKKFVTSSDIYENREGILALEKDIADRRKQIDAAVDAFLATFYRMNYSFDYNSSEGDYSILGEEDFSNKTIQEHWDSIRNAVCATGSDINIGSMCSKEVVLLEDSKGQQQYRVDLAICLEVMNPEGFNEENVTIPVGNGTNMLFLSVYFFEDTDGMRVSAWLQKSMIYKEEKLFSNNGIEVITEIDLPHELD